MSNIVRILIISIPIITACVHNNSKISTSNINENQKSVCSTLFDQMSSENSNINQYIFEKYVANGCSNIMSTDVPGDESTVLVHVKKQDIICSGVVVSEHFVLTAAHCFYEEFKTKKNKIKYKYVLKETKNDPKNIIEIGIGKSKYSNSMQFVETEKIIINHMYDETFVSPPVGDLALLKTKDSLKKFSLTPAKVTQSKVDGEMVWFIGYGSLKLHDVNSIGIKRWGFSVLSKPYFENSYYTHPELFPSSIITKTDKVILKKAIFKYQNAIKNKWIDVQKAPSIEKSFLVIDKKEPYQRMHCSGDSGGPEFVKRNGNIFLISITHGINGWIQGPEADAVLYNNRDYCNEYNSGINTWVSPYIEWINQQMEPYNEKLESSD